MTVSCEKCFFLICCKFEFFGCQVALVGMDGTGGGAVGEMMWKV